MEHYLAEWPVVPSTAYIASGAMALKLNGVDGDLIMKMGQWSSTTWLTYIHSQISSLTAGLSERMALSRVALVTPTAPGRTDLPTPPTPATP
jgi:hypothetical protein